MNARDKKTILDMQNMVAAESRKSWTRMQNARKAMEKVYDTRKTSDRARNVYEKAYAAALRHASAHDKAVVALATIGTLNYMLVVKNTEVGTLQSSVKTILY